MRYFIYYASFIILFCSCGNRDHSLFYSVPSSESGIDFENNLIESDSLNIIEYLYFYNGGGVAVGDINNDGLPDIYLSSNQQGNKLYLNKTKTKDHIQFEDITKSSGTIAEGDWKTGVSMADVNGDGWLDIYVCEVGDYKSIHGRNQLLINNHDLTFTESAAKYNLDITAFSTQAAWFDYDRDGDLDMYLLCHSVHSTDTYKDTSIRNQVDFLKGDRLMQNQNGTFINVSKQSGILSSPVGYGLGVGISDLNDDGWPDIVIGNDFHENDYLYINDQRGGFRQSQRESFDHTCTFSMGSDIADINNDGFPDIFSLDMKPDDEEVFKNSVGADPYDIYQYKTEFGYHYQYPRNSFQLYQYTDAKGTPYFSEIAQELGVARTDWSWTPLIVDFDNNGLQDIFVANGIAHRPNDLDYLKYFSSLGNADTAKTKNLISQMPVGKAKNFFFSQESNLQFINQSVNWNPENKDLSTAAAYADFDKDGDMDIIINRINAPCVLLRNQNSANHYLQLRLYDTSQNKFDIGARVTVYSGDIKFVRELFPTRGFQSSSDYLLHFGLGSISELDSVIIRWPDGFYSKKMDLNVDSTYLITRPKTRPYDFMVAKNATNFSIANDGVNYIHHENVYNDFEREKLLINKLSTQGPACAIADINGDGLDDLWIGGARNQAGIIYLQSTTHTFVALAQNALDEHAAFEDIDGTWADIDNDKDPDLIVLSGGYQLDNPALLVDRIYLNDGKGNLTYSQNALPASAHMSGCIAVNDIDDDGDPDIFIGGRVAPYYGFNTDSYLLLNDGTGIFKISNIPVFRGLGMVTDAIWANVLPEVKGKELIVAGEWMPITIIKRNGPGWEKQVIPNSEGMWQCIQAGDFDQDGNLDLIGGNMGLNIPWTASIKEPVELFAADFDRNTSPEAIISYYVNGAQYSFFNKDELVSQIISFKKKYTDYRSFSKSDFTSVFKEFDLSRDHKKIVTLSSSLFLNAGKGNFTLSPLPFEAQQSIMMSILVDDLNNDQFPDILYGGNLFEVMPSFGRLDGSHGGLLFNNQKGNLNSVRADISGIFIKGAIRDIEKVKMGDKFHYIFIRNNESPVIFK